MVFCSYWDGPSGKAQYKELPVSKKIEAKVGEEKAQSVVGTLKDVLDVTGEVEFEPVNSGRSLTGGDKKGSPNRELKAIQLRTGTVQAQSRRQACRLLNRVMELAGMNVAAKRALADQVVASKGRAVDVQFGGRAVSGKIGFVAAASRDQVQDAVRALFVAAKGMGKCGPEKERAEWLAVASALASVPLVGLPQIGVDDEVTSAS